MLNEIEAAQILHEVSKNRTHSLTEVEAAQILHAANLPPAPNKANNRKPRTRKTFAPPLARKVLTDRGR